LKKLIYLIFNSALEPEITDLLKKLNVCAYTKWEKVKGRGECGPHLDDEVWPAVNIALMLVVDESMKDTLAEGVRKIRGEFPGEGIRMLVLPFEEIV